MGSSLKDIVNHYPYKNDLKYFKYYVQQTLDESIEKIKVSILMPRFLENIKMVSIRLKNTEFDKCAKKLRSYNRDEKAVINKCQRGSLTQYQEQSLIRLIDCFQENYGILAYFADWLEDLTNAERTSLSVLALIIKTTRSHFDVGGLEQLKEEQVLSNIYQDHKQILQDLKNVERLLVRDHPLLRWKIAARETAFLSAEHSARMHLGNAEDVRKKASIECAERKNPHLFLGREKKAQENLERETDKLEKTKAFNQREGELVRADRDRYLLQYKALIKKYDDHMSEKFHEIIYLKKSYDELVAKHQNFVKFTFEPAQKIYFDIVKAKEIEAEQKRQAKINAFIQNRAARVIQLAYRAYLRIHKPELVPKPPKKKDKGKKGKK